jgi:PAS domain S-box-containing protein
MSIVFFILCFNAGIALIGAIIAWTRRKIPATVPLIFLNIAVISWSVGYAFELITPDLGNKFNWIIIEYTGIALVPVTLFFLSYEHMKKQKIRSPAPVLPLLIVPVFVFILLCTNGQHHLFYKQFEFTPAGDGHTLVFQYGIIFWIHTAYSYGVLVASMVLLIRALFVLPSVYQRQTLTFIGASFIPWLTNALYLFRLFPFLKIDPSPFSFTVTGIITLFGLLYYNLFDFLPFAADTIINNLNDSIFIVSQDNKLLKINPLAEELLECRSSECIGRNIRSIFKQNLQPLSDILSGEQNHIHLHFPKNNEIIYFDCKVSPIRMGKRVVAKAVILRDITPLKKAELSLKNWNIELEQRIIIRTRELSDVNKHLKNEIKKRELLLKEIHHRVKNNLAIIRSLIYIQSSSIKDEVVQDMFKDLTSRVASIGLIHEKLYKSEDFQTIRLDNYLSELMESHIQTFSDKGTPIIFDKEIEPITLDINTIIPLGLIFTELVTNSIKYAQRENGENLLAVRAQKRDFIVTIVLSDSGPGFPASVIRGEKVGTGLKVIEVLIKQLNGTIVFENDHGAKTTLSIPVLE